MATLKTNMQSDVDNVMLNTTEFGESITYTAHGGSGTSINAIVNRRVCGEIVETEQGLMKLWEYDILVSGTNVSSPNPYDEYTIDSMTFDVADIQDKTAESMLIIVRHWEQLGSTEREHTREVS